MHSHEVVKAWRYLAISAAVFAVSVGIFATGSILTVKQSIYDKRNMLSLAEVRNASDTEEKIPRILHATWRDDQLPEQFQEVTAKCREMHPGYRYMLWTDELAADLVKNEFPELWPTFEGYRYPIQRADAIASIPFHSPTLPRLTALQRYAILYRFGGIYLDLDVGCQKKLDDLLHFDVVLPLSHKPTEIFNDCMLAAKGHAFFAHVLDFLPAFDRNWIFKKQTVMASTGPNFLAAVFALYPRELAHEIRFMSDRLYGRYPGPKDAPHPDAFFTHRWFYSWEDASSDAHARITGWLLIALGTMLLISIFVCCVRRYQRPKGPVAL